MPTIYEKKIMNIRYKTDGSRQILFMSEPAFTTSPGAGEADVVISGNLYPYPGPVALLRLTDNLAELEVDPVRVVSKPSDFRGTTDALVQWLVEQLNIVRAGLPAPLSAIDIAEARRQLKQTNLRKGA